MTDNLQVAISEFHASLEAFLALKAIVLSADWGEGLSFLQSPAAQSFAEARTRYRVAVRDLADELQATDRRVRVVLLASSPCSYCGEMVADDKYMQHLADEHSVKDILANANEFLNDAETDWLFIHGANDKILGTLGIIPGGEIKNKDEGE